jgi:hypothetical protein
MTALKAMTSQEGERGQFCKTLSGVIRQIKKLVCHMEIVCSRIFLPCVHSAIGFLPCSQKHSSPFPKTSRGYLYGKNLERRHLFGAYSGDAGYESLRMTELKICTHNLPLGAGLDNMLYISYHGGLSLMRLTCALNVTWVAAGQRRLIPLHSLTAFSRLGMPSYRPSFTVHNTSKRGSRSGTDNLVQRMLHQLFFRLESLQV